MCDQRKAIDITMISCWFFPQEIIFVKKLKLFEMDPFDSERVKKLIFLTSMSHTSSTSNTVHILLNVTWQVKVHDMTHIGDIQTTSSHLQKIVSSVHIVIAKI